VREEWRLLSTANNMHKLIIAANKQSTPKNTSKTLEGREEEGEEGWEEFFQTAKIENEIIAIKRCLAFYLVSVLLLFLMFTFLLVPIKINTEENNTQPSLED